jgi:hypothetical protein
MGVPLLLLVAIRIELSRRQTLTNWLKSSGVSPTATCGGLMFLSLSNGQCFHISSYGGRLQAAVTAPMVALRGGCLGLVFCG